VSGLKVMGSLSGADFATLCASLPRHETLRELSFSSCADARAAALAVALRGNASLTALHLVCCGVGDAGVAALAEMLHHNTTLRTLDLRNCAYLGDAGLVPLGEALRVNGTLEVLLLDSVDDGLSAAAKAALRRGIRSGRVRDGPPAESSHPW
jgi:hypothetical protein